MKLEDLGREWTGKVYVYWNTKYGGLTFDHEDVLSGSDQYVLIGTSEPITITFIGRDELVTRHVAALRAEKQHLLAESQQQVEQIEQQIQSLLAIEHKPEVS